MPYIVTPASRALKTIGLRNSTISRLGRVRGPEIPTTDSLLSPNDTVSILPATLAAEDPEWYVGQCGEVLVPFNVLPSTKLRIVFTPEFVKRCIVRGAILRFKYHLAAAASHSEDGAAPDDRDPILLPLDYRISSFGWSGIDSIQDAEGSSGTLSASPVESTEVLLYRSVPYGQEIDISVEGTISEPVFSGDAAEDDIELFGEYTGDSVMTISLEVYSVGATDKFTWTDGTTEHGPYAMSVTGIAITDGVLAKWTAKNGHTSGTIWTFTLTPASDVSTGLNATRRAELLIGEVRKKKEYVSQTTYETRPDYWDPNKTVYVPRTVQVLRETPLNSTSHALSMTIDPYISPDRTSGGITATDEDASIYSDIVTSGEHYTGWGLIRYGGKNLAESAVVGYFRIPGDPREPAGGGSGVQQNLLKNAVLVPIKTTSISNYPTAVTLYYPGDLTRFHVGNVINIAWKWPIRGFCAVQLMYNPFSLSVAEDSGGSATDAVDEYSFWSTGSAYLNLTEPVEIAGPYSEDSKVSTSFSIDMTQAKSSATGVATSRLKLGIISLDVVVEDLP